METRSGSRVIVWLVVILAVLVLIPLLGMIGMMAMGGGTALLHRAERSRRVPSRAVADPDGVGGPRLPEKGALDGTGHSPDHHSDAAAVMLVMIPFTVGEVAAMGQFMAERVRAGKPF